MYKYVQICTDMFQCEYPKKSFEGTFVSSGMEKGGIIFSSVSAPSPVFNCKN